MIEPLDRADLFKRTHQRQTDFPLLYVQIEGQESFLLGALQAFLSRDLGLFRGFLPIGDLRSVPTIEPLTGKSLDRIPTQVPYR